MKKKPDKILHFYRRGSISVWPQTSSIFKVHNYSKSKFNQNASNLLSIEVATCFDWQSDH